MNTLGHFNLKTADQFCVYCGDTTEGIIHECLDVDFNEILRLCVKHAEFFYALQATKNPRFSEGEIWALNELNNIKGK